MQTAILKKFPSAAWETGIAESSQLEATQALENGNILLFPHLAFDLLPEEKKFLSPHYAVANTKNISFNIHTNVLGGVSALSPLEQQNLQAMLRRFANCTYQFLKNTLPAYAEALQVGRTSFRPIEIAGRVSASYRKDDKRLHVDAFPANPNQGRRILRVFTNINPHAQARIWRVGEPFIQVAQQFLPYVRLPWPGQAFFLKALRITKSYRTAYDHIMLQIHDRMKADLAYQKAAAQCELHLMPGSSWIVQTDHVSHAALAGQYVLEQTFYLPIAAMLNSELSPLRILEKLMGRSLKN